MRTYCFIALIILFASINITAQNDTPTPEETQKKAVLLIEKEGVQATLDFLKDYFAESKDETTIFLVAWAEYTNNNLTAAEKLAHYCIEIASTEEILANAYHLIGNIKKLNDLNQSMSYLEKGLRVFEIIRHHEGIYRSYLSMTQVALEKNNVELANKYHVLALRIAIEQDQNMLYYHLVGHFLRVATKEYDLAKQHLLDVIELANTRENTVQAVEAKMHLVTLEYLLGNYADAHTLNQELVGYFEKHKDQTRKSFTLLNQFFISKCHQQAPDFNLSEDDIKVMITSQDTPKYYNQIYQLLRDTGCK